MYRVFDNEKREWISNVYMSPDGDLYMAKKNIFGTKLIYLTQDDDFESNEDIDKISVDRYIVHRDIDLYDKNNVLIYQGDIVRANVADNKMISGLVTYANELASYIILCYDTDEYYVLGESVTTKVEVVGNILENRELLLGSREDDDGQ